MYEALWIEVPYSTICKILEWKYDLDLKAGQSGEWSDSLKDIFYIPGTVIGIRDTKIKQEIQSVGRDKHVNRFLEFYSWRITVEFLF